jgi:hypothetical protein
MLAIAAREAVSVLRTLFPNKTDWNPAPLASSISWSLKPPSGPIKIVAIEVGLISDNLFVA